MKAKLYFLFFLLLTLNSCNEKSPEKNASDEDILSTKLELTELDVSQYHNPIYLQGEFEHWINSDGNVVVYTQAGDTKHQFILEGVSENSDLSINIKEVLFLDHFFFLSGPEKTYLLTLDDHTTSQAMDLPYFSEKQVDKIYGEGIVHKWTSADHPSYKDINKTSLKQGEIGEISSGDDNCDSGGSGATSCSITSSTGTGCFVSCGEGKYACCKQTAIGPDSCTCKDKE